MRIVRKFLSRFIKQSTFLISLWGLISIGCFISYQWNQQFSANESIMLLVTKQNDHSIAPMNKRRNEICSKYIFLQFDLMYLFYTVSQKPHCARFSRVFTCSPIV